MKFSIDEKVLRASLFAGILGRYDRRMKSRADVRTSLDDTRDIMRNIITSVNSKTENGLIEAMGQMANLQEKMTKLKVDFENYSSSRLRTLGKDDETDINFILDEELDDMQEFIDDAHTLYCRELETKRTKRVRSLLNMSLKQLGQTSHNFRMFSNSVKEFKREVKDQSESKVRQREVQHYADIQHDVEEIDPRVYEALTADGDTKKSAVSVLERLAELMCGSAMPRASLEAVRDAIAYSSYGEVDNRMLDFIFATNAIKARIGRPKSLAERLGIHQRVRKSILDRFPREGLLNTIEQVAEVWFGRPLSCRTSAAEKKENTMYMVSFFSAVFGDFDNIKSHVKELYDFIASKFHGCLLSYDPFLDRINDVIEYEATQYNKLRSKARKAYDSFLKIKNFVWTKLVEMHSTLVNISHPDIC